MFRVPCPKGNGTQTVIYSNLNDENEIVDYCINDNVSRLVLSRDPRNTGRKKLRLPKRKEQKKIKTLIKQKQSLASQNSTEYETEKSQLKV